jgi:hypothetical protein
MWLDVGAMALFLIVGNVVFRHFEPMASVTRRVLKVLLILVITAAVSYYFGRTGVIVAFAVACLPIVYIHGIWLPRRGINGWTGEPRDKYYALRGWPPPKA